MTRCFHEKNSNSFAHKLKCLLLLLLNFRFRSSQSRLVSIFFKLLFRKRQFFTVLRLKSRQNIPEMQLLHFHDETCSKFERTSDPIQVCRHLQNHKILLFKFNYSCIRQRSVFSLSPLFIFVKTPRHRLRFLRLESRRFTTRPT